MLKSFLTTICVAFLVGFAGHGATSQQLSAPEQSRVAEREAEWARYPLPKTTFVRHTDSAHALLFHVPSDWKREQPDKDKVSFSGPHGATLNIFIEKIPDGSPLREYVAAMMQPLRSLPDGAESMVVRRTTMAALEAREIMFETNVDSVEVSRRIIWSTVSGPNAFSLLLIVPLANVAEVEPSFKAIVQSVTLLEKFDYAGFDAMRSVAIKDPQPFRVDEGQSLANDLASLDGSSRQSNITRLAAMFASSPGTVVDLVLDGRPMVRAAAFEAISQSGNKSLEKFLLRALDDRELFVAEQAVRSIAANSDVIELLRLHSLEWFKTEALGRVWPFLTGENKVRVLKDIFALPPPSSRKSPARTTANAIGSAKTRPSPSPEPSPGKPRVTVRATVLPPGAPPPRNISEGVVLTSDPSRHLNGLTLLKDLPPSAFKTPFTQLLAWESDSLTTLALQVAWERNEPLPASELLKLLFSSNNEIRRLAALNLGESGSVADIKTIEGYVATAASNVAPNKGQSSNAEAPFNDLQLTISKIRFREGLSTSSAEARRELIKKGLADPKLADWIWSRYVSESVDLEKAALEPAQSTRGVKVLKLGENLFPKDVTYYAALPNPESALDKLGGAIDGLQLESARSQANFVLILSVLREQLAQQLGSPPNVSPFTYSGVNTKEPIALASWYADGAPGAIQSAERAAVILRVSDRARFERTLTLYQQSIGSFSSLSGYSSGIVRFLTLMPVFLPLTGKAMLEGPGVSSKQPALLRYSFVRETKWNGYSIKVVEQRRVDSNGSLTTDAAYLAYLGDTAVLAPDLNSLRDVLTRAGSEQATLAANRDFKRLVENPGEAIYLSNLRLLFAAPNTNEISSKDAMTESGALKISNSSWENLYQLKFRDNDWLKPFKNFHPDELTSPKELLPRSTIAYYFMNIDSVPAWRHWGSELLKPDQYQALMSAWAPLDFEKDVLPELGPECGMAVLGLPDIITGNWDIPWAAFFKLKSDKLTRALEAAKVLGGSAASPGPIHLKLKSGDLFVVVKGNFLVVSNSRQAIAGLDQKEKLNSSRDFSRAARQAPPAVMAFGGYSLEAAISSIGDSGSDPLRTQQSALIFSLTKAFHSPNFYAMAAADEVQARFSLSMDREGRFSVSELSSLSQEFRHTYAQVEARGVPIQNQERLSSLKVKIRAKAAGELDRIKEDVASPYQKAEKISESELELTVLPRRSEPKTSLVLPIQGAEFLPYLQPARDIPSDDKTVIEKARSIAGDERDAWKVATKLADWTYKNIKWKQVDYATARQTLATLEADCLEFSQLYVAMARSLGLPARLVSGLAYSGATFGGHAWVEVYVGEWMEVDPTWGTAFVDATHIRNSPDGALLTYASLNLVQLEVLAAPRGIQDFQKDPRALAEKLVQELPRGGLTALTSALDLGVLTNENFGAGAWDQLSDVEREAMTSAYRRVLLEISTGFRKESEQAQNLRLLKVDVKGESAEGLVIDSGIAEPLAKFTLVRRNDAWFLTEIHQVDADFHIIGEILGPTIKTIRNRRSNKSATTQSTSDVVRVLLLIEKDAKGSIAIADRALKEDPKHQGLRHLKAIALTRIEKPEEAIALWQELANETRPFAPALLSLAGQYEYSEDKAKQKQAVEFYTRYLELEPDDPRAHVALARLHENSEDYARAEAEHRAALKTDPANTGNYVDFAAFLAVRKRLAEAHTVIVEAEKKAKAEDDLFGDLMVQLYFADENSVSEELATSQPQRMEKSATANLYLGYLRLDDGKALQAIPVLRKAAALKIDWSEPYGAMARGYRTLRNWTAALQAADAAIKIDAEDSDAYFHKACALARLGRIKDALKSLAKAVELDPDLAETIGEEADLKALAPNPAFKKLLAVEEKK